MAYPETHAIIERDGEYWKLHPDGAIERRLHGAEYHKSSFNWRVVGAAELDHRQNIRTRYTLEDVLYGDLAWKYTSNGNQKTRIIDYDHGHTRMWGNMHEVRHMTRPNLLTPESPWNRVPVCFGGICAYISGPFFKSDMAYGARGMADAKSTLHRSEWYVSWKTFTLVTPERDPAYEAEFGPGTIVVPYPVFTDHIHSIVNFRGQERYLVSRAYPSFEEPTLDTLIRRLVVNGDVPRVGS